MKTINEIATKLGATRYQVGQLVKRLGLEPADRVGTIRLFSEPQVALVQERFEDVRLLVESGLTINRVADTADAARLIGCSEARVQYHLRVIIDGYRRALAKHEDDPDTTERPTPRGVVYRRPYGQSELWPLGLIWQVRAAIQAAGNDARTVEREVAAFDLQKTEPRFLTHEEVFADECPAILPESYAMVWQRLRPAAKTAVARASAKKETD